jgi:hypothetical protein
LEGEFPHLGRRALNTLLPFITSYPYETGFSAVVAIKTKYRSMMNPKNYYFRVAISKLQNQYDKLVQKGNHIRPTNGGRSSIFFVRSFKLNALNNT